MKSLLEIEAMNEELTRQNFQSKLRLLEIRERPEMLTAAPEPPSR